ncbi:DUF397 domain-containing protein [Streptomyces sp. HUAS MG91]|uniref:DUF397 domain-containing protein n=1 Tax=Streptomyces tabacisoli TaxID=3156398 RepID=A0AAU8IX02_9ACTN
MNASLTWFKSSYSDSQGGNCLEAATSPTRIYLRDSKLGPQSPTFSASAPAWNAFLAHARTV